MCTCAFSLNFFRISNTLLITLEKKMFITSLYIRKRAWGWGWYDNTGHDENRWTLYLFLFGGGRLYRSCTNSLRNFQKQFSGYHILFASLKRISFFYFFKPIWKCVLNVWIYKRNSIRTPINAFNIRYQTCWELT